jgi:tRNA-2-methylthio-N6-dimethylallyladenosine synthase
MNEYDSNRISSLLKKINYTKSNNLKDTNCFILNTCHIREKATDKVYHEIGRVKKEFRNKNKPIVIVAGCVAQAEGEILIERENYIDAVIGPQSYHQINDLILKLEKKAKKINLTHFDVVEKFDTLSSLKNFDNKVSSFLTIQEGCDKFCKFCVVPYTRGAEYSRSTKELIMEANQLVKNGSREISLLGQNVNAYNFKKKKLSNLISEISKIKKLNRIRYTTSHPVDFTDDLIEVHKSCEKLMPLVHLPVQSGSNKILKAMNRKHTIQDYLRIIEKLKKIRPDIKFSSDFIIGYPGETIEDFNETIKLMQTVKFINSYSFIFNARPGTPAFNLSKVDNKKAKDRLIEFQLVADKIKKDYRESFINKTAKVLFENKLKSGNDYFGRDEYFNSVIVPNDKDLSGKIKIVKILSVNQGTLYGEVIQNLNQTNFAA